MTSLRRRVQREFTRQGEAMERSALFRSEAIAERFREALGPAAGGRLLDLACGPGLLTAALAAAAREVVALDVTHPMLARARRACREVGAVHAVQGAAEALPLPDACFDAVVTRLSVHHLADPASPLCEMRRVLRPGGRLVLADIVGATDPADAALHDALETLRDPTHVRLLPAGELEAAVAAAGFRIRSRSAWQVRRPFEEWAAIVGDPERTAPLEVVMRHLARAGLRAGVDLREAEDGTLSFVHSWLLLAAEPAGPVGHDPGPRGRRSG